MTIAMPLHRTRIKLCGLTQPADVDHAVALGADAIGLVFYPPSPRGVTAEQAAELARLAGPFVTVTGLFVNASADDVARVVEQVPLTLLQFHGDETPEQCADIAARVGLPWLRAARVQPGTDLVEFADRFAAAQGLLLDAFVEGYGGGGPRLRLDPDSPAMALAIAMLANPKRRSSARFEWWVERAKRRWCD